MEAIREFSSTLYENLAIYNNFYSIIVFKFSFKPFGRMHCRTDVFPRGTIFKRLFSRDKKSLFNRKTPYFLLYIFFNMSQYNKNLLNFIVLSINKIYNYYTN